MQIYTETMNIATYFCIFIQYFPFYLDYKHTALYNDYRFEKQTKEIHNYGKRN